MDGVHCEMSAIRFYIGFACCLPLIVNNYPLHIRYKDFLIRFIYIMCQGILTGTNTTEHHFSYVHTQLFCLKTAEWHGFWFKFIILNQHTLFLFHYPVINGFLCIQKNIKPKSVVKGAGTVLQNDSKVNFFHTKV